MNIKNLIRCCGLLLALSILTACATPRILSHEVDGLCLVTQQDMILSRKKFKDYGTTNYSLRTTKNWHPPFTIDTIGYQEIGDIPHFTRLSIFRVYEVYDSLGYYAPRIVAKLEQGEYRNILAVIPSWQEHVVDPVTGRSVTMDGTSAIMTKSLWFTARDTIDIPRKVFSRSDVNKIKFNPEYLKKCD
ncbi:hypothetical protein MMO38_04950 [Acinetobacter sp. NIPH 1852]|uniref:hypothetical protein n=1 Tax=Acinetobacter sp. NIPH 1852 TaxID=2923428 RepID=UPI001B477618|nr:hypothetical protein [Acinetobacter sp. NIPH 1852]MBP8006518.1 hypothetical protein [Acinetobacter sp.]MCH7307496.1 hypothetical protein [Acinetobacter sp. NIPH 1852]